MSSGVPASAAPLDVRVVTGLSGSGKSTALRVLEDLGWFCVDNLPTLLVAHLVRICAGRGDVRGVALGIDAREKSFLAGFPQAIAELRAAGHKVEILFLDARDEALLRRFSSTRRPHPLSPEGEVLAGVRCERAELAPMRAVADRVLDTSDLTVHELRRKIIDHLSRGADPSRGLVVRVLSFGFTFGVPIDADVVLDARFLPNPYFVDELRALPGTDPRVAAFVTSGEEARWFLDTVAAMFARLLPHYVRDGRSYLTIAIGCTGGRHRSVALAEALAARLPVQPVEVRHRDVTREGGGGSG
ncbi:MAG: RNase adapter RapZ [Deltaproteobacteria bacterium]|nr:RNase adapter RapZ [Deltaproteobacteria bacterium]